MRYRKTSHVFSDSLVVPHHVVDAITSAYAAEQVKKELYAQYREYVSDPHLSQFYSTHLGRYVLDTNDTILFIIGQLLLGKELCAIPTTKKGLTYAPKSTTEEILGKLLERRERLLAILCELFEKADTASSVEELEKLSYEVEL